MKVLGHGNLYPVGFMGSGKDKVGNLVAERMRRRIVNTDALIVDSEAMSINDIFDKYGEPYFRDSETEVLREISRERDLVVSVGGGAFCQENPRNRDILLATGVVVWLDVSLDIIRERLKNKTDRPLARNPVEMAKLFEKRRQFYELADFRLEVSVERPPEEVAEELLRRISWKELV